jgi:hypothetical protein
MSDTIPLISRNALDAFSNIVLGAVNLRRIFLLLTRLHFSDSSNYGAMKEELSKFVWSKDPKLSRIFIGLDYVFDIVKSDQFPGVFVGVGDLDFQQKVIQNLSGITEDKSGSENVIEGTTTIIIRHASLSPDEALALADLSFGFYTGVRQFLVSRMKLNALTVNRLSTPRFFNIDGTEKADKKFCADLILGIAWDASWTSFVESHPVKKIVFGDLVDRCG